MKNLPTEVTRCRPQEPDSHCANCKRWADHPEQVLWMVVRLVNTTNSRDEACAYVPISRVKEAA